MAGESTTVTVKTEGGEAAVVATEGTGTTTTETKTPAVAETRTENMVPQSRLDKATAEKWEERRAREEVANQLALAQETIKQLQTKTPESTTVETRKTPVEKPLTAAELQALVNAQASEMEFNKACNASVAKGKTLYKDFDETLAGLRKISPFFDPKVGGPVLPKPLVEAALETGAAEEILYALGKDSSEADRIMSLPPIKQAMEIAKFHSRLEAKKAAEAAVVEPGEEGETPETPETPEAENISRAPAPIRPAASRGTRPAFSIYDTKNTTTADWIAQRNAQIARAKANGARR